MVGFHRWRHLEPSMDVTDEFKTDYNDTNVCLVTGQYSWSGDHTNGTWNSSAVSLVDLPDAPGYKGANQNSGMTWAGNDTYLYSYQNWTTRCFTIHSALTTSQRHMGNGDVQMPT